MARSYRKNILRTFSSTKSRFIAIFSIVALGVGFLAGLGSTAPDMKDSMEQYLDSANFYDLRVVSTLGLTDADVDALRAVEGVADAKGAYSADLLIQQGEEDVLVARVHSLPQNPADQSETIDRLTLVDGRWPTAPGECVVEASGTGLARSIALGDTFTATADNVDLADKLVATDYTVVGTVHDARYFSFEREPASVGSGTVNLVFYLQPQDFAYEAYTEVELTAADAAGLDSLDAAYEDKIAAVTHQVEGIEQARCQARYEGIRADAQVELDDGWQEYNDAKADADRELADAAAELADGEQKLADGEQELADGERDYTDGAATLAENAQTLADGVAALQAAQDQLTEGQAAYEEGVRRLADGETQLSEGKKTLEDAQRQYEEGRAVYDSARAALTEGEAQLSEGKATLLDAQTAYEEGTAALAAQKPALEQGRAQYQQLLQLNQGQKAYDAAVQQLIDQYAAYGVILSKAQAEALFSDAALAAMVMSTPESAMTPEELQNYRNMAALNAAKKQLDAGVAAIIAQATPESAMTEEEVRALFSDASLAMLDAQLTAGETQLAEGEAQLAAAKSQLDAGWAEYEKNAAVLAAGRAQLDATAPQLSAAKEQLDAGWAAYESNGTTLYGGLNELRASKKTLDEGWATLTDRQSELADAQRKIADARATLADARAELDDARATIAEKKQELADGKIDYATAKADAERELADAYTELQDAQAELDDLEKPEWYLWDRSSNVSFASFDSNVAKLAAIARVFPMFFFLVAALVVSTTMTRMVEEERLQIGTMKALGYTQGDIMKKYLWYALAAAVAGTGAGLAVGFNVFPRMIWNAYTIIYYLPHLYVVWRWDYALLAGGTLTACALLITWLTCRATLRETPADLMRPRAPKAGKRILLERVGPVWRRLPFSYKVTCRNLLRYKKRFWMTVIGVAGCTALLVTGFGLSDSINAIITKQYNDVYHYDLMTAVTKASATTGGPVYDTLFGGDAFTQSIATATEKVEQDNPNGGKLETYLMIPRDVAAFANFADLHDRVTQTPTPLGETGVVLTEKLAATLGVTAGDRVTLQNSDGVFASFAVTGVCEHYVFNYIYMSANTYTEGFEKEPGWNAILSILPDTSQAARDRISAQLLDLDDVASVTFTLDSMQMVLNMLTAINSVMGLIVACAAALAFIVLYNLTNINIAERVKEIATIKVLGFYDREVGAYINRESAALTFIGALFGLVAGVGLHRFVILTVEVDAVMFGREVHPISFVYAFALTMAFGFTVNLIMRRKLHRVSMVESMKAPE